MRVGRQNYLYFGILYHSILTQFFLDNSQLNLCRVFVFDNVLLNRRASGHAACYIAWLIAASHSHLSSLNAASASTVWSFA